MRFIFAVLGQTIRNLLRTFSSQVLTMVTITLSVLIFAFFALIYTNLLNAGEQLGDDLRLIAYLDEAPPPCPAGRIQKKNPQI
jgi:cell division transport system permease protein